MMRPFIICNSWSQGSKKCPKKFVVFYFRWRVSKNHSLFFISVDFFNEFNESTKSTKRIQRINEKNFRWFDQISTNFQRKFQRINENFNKFNENFNESTKISTNSTKISTDQRKFRKINENFIRWFVEFVDEFSNQYLFVDFSFGINEINESIFLFSTKRIQRINIFNEKIFFLEPCSYRYFFFVIMNSNRKHFLTRSTRK